MIDVKNATKLAVEYIKSVYSGCKEIKLEEVDSSEDDKFWYITLSFILKEDAEDILFIKRQYKIIKINALTGKIQSMKIRQLNE